ncbi:unnamed protein product [Adineta steineri]|uniref:Uncharacterized protein n=1 Tax=Adineta steineri TaxID=433720 RepID=A0A815NTK0_9BILA|nr:unnamed protein product [Adineta steineri]CAF1436593.1 unnamed protein product [Adineta steineri]CAF3616982.1 unnamed protein product [Adineta steineri]
MPFLKDRIFNTDSTQSTSSITEYNTHYMLPRREDYIPHVALPKFGNNRIPTRSRSFLSFDVDPNFIPKTSEYGLGFTNHRPKRPYVFQAKSTHIFDDPFPAPDPIRLNSSSSVIKSSEYQARFANNRTKDLVTGQISSQANIPSDPKLKKERMTRSQYFHDLITDSDKSNGGQRYFGNSEQRLAFQWPSHIQEEISNTYQPTFRQSLYTSN